MEAIYRVTAMNLKHSSRDVVFVPSDHQAIRLVIPILLYSSVCFYFLDHTGCEMKNSDILAQILRASTKHKFFLQFTHLFDAGPVLLNKILLFTN